MISIAIERAKTNVMQLLADKEKITKNSASALQSFAVNQTVTWVQGQHRKIQLEHIQKIHAHLEHGVNTNGHGVLVASVYEGDDGSLYKQAGKEWYYWDGSSWRS